MKLEPLVLRSFTEGVLPDQSAAGRKFIPLGEKPVEEEVYVEPTYGEADLKNAEREGFQKGFLEGIKEGHRQAENEQDETNKRVLALADKFQRSLLPMFEDHAAAMRKLQAQLPEISLRIARKVAGAALEDNAHRLLHDVVASCLETMSMEPKLTITVNAALGDKMEHMLQDMASRLPESTHIIIVRDEDMHIADCRVEWKYGSMQHSVQDIWQKVEEMIAGAAHIAAKDREKELSALAVAVTGSASNHAGNVEAAAPTENKTEE